MAPMGGRWLGVSAVGLLAASCGDRIVTLDLPPLDGARSAVFAFHGPDRFEARAVDLEAGEVAVVFPGDLSYGAEGSVEALGFSSTLGELGLQAGRIDSVTDGAPLKKEDTVFVATFRGSATDEWVAVSARSPEVDALRIPVSVECAQFEDVSSFILDTSADLSFALALGPERVLLGYEDESAFVVDPSGAARVTDRPSRLPLRDVLELDDGSLLFAGSSGRIWSGRITTSTSGSPIRIEGEPFTEIPGTDTIVQFAGGRDNGALELFAIVKEGGFYRFDGTSWRLLYDLGIRVGTATSVVRVRPGLAYTGTDESSVLVRYLDGSVGPFSPPDLFNGIPGLAYFSGVGLLASISEGGIFRLSDDLHWELLEGSPIAVNVYSFYQLPDSFLFGSAFGFLSEYRFGVGYCPPVQLSAGALRSMTPFGEDGFVFGEDRPMSRDFDQVTIVRRLR